MLKNAQPLAFMASLSIIIAAFTFDEDKLPNVSSNAIIAAFMFLISFVLSLIDQIPIKKENGDMSPLRFGKYFFLGIGILYLLLITWEFSKSLTQIGTIVVGWLTLSVGVTTLPILILRKGKFTKHQTTSIFAKLATATMTIFSSSFIVVGGGTVASIFLTQKFDERMLSYLHTGIMTAGFLAIPISLLFIYLDIRKEKNKIIKTKK